MFRSNVLFFCGYCLFNGHCCVIRVYFCVEFHDTRLVEVLRVFSNFTCVFLYVKFHDARLSEELSFFIYFTCVFYMIGLGNLRHKCLPR